MSGGRFALALVAGGVVIAVCVIALNFFDPPAQSVRATSAALTIAEQQALAPTLMDVKRGLLASAGLGGSVLIVSLCLGLSFLVLREPLLLRHHKGIFPAHFAVLGLRASDPPGNPEAHAEYARVAGVQRPLGRPALPRPDAQLALPAPDDLTVELDPVEVLAPELDSHPHKLIIAESRFGKTNLAWAIIRRYQAALPDCEFLVLSMIESKWPDLQVASTVAQMVSAMTAVEQELIRRDKLLKQLKITDVHESDVLNAFVVIFDEVETSFELASGAQRAEFTRLVTRYVNQAGNVKGSMISLSQTGSRGIIPKGLLANADLYIGRCGTYVPASFSIQEPVLVNALSRAEKGSWYSYRHRAWFTAPLVKPPHDVRLWSGWKPTLELAADGEADGMGANDAPDGAALPLLPTDGEGGVWPDFGVGVGVGDSRGYTFAIDETFKRRVLEVWDGLEKPNYTAVQKIMFPDQEDGGAHWKAIKAVIIARREVERQRHRKQYLEATA